jgi:hypothetical protein
LSMNPVSTNWARPVLKEMGLLENRAAQGDLDVFRNELERWKLVDRVRETASHINQEANRQILELLEFLPPARSIVRVGFASHKANAYLEIVVRPSGPKAVFYTYKKPRVGLTRFFGGDNSAPSCKVEFSLQFRPEAVTSGDLRMWFVYLISGFKQELRPIGKFAAA